jgi:hypothetical protein
MKAIYHFCYQNCTFDYSASDTQLQYKTCLALIVILMNY